ncbi:unannotated protein [freshwater metagenome]|uniref:Unannotated protein n=1 Tax=freshwater metagenome TaxID=449393 RepID=A0A6J7GJZ1_9ZZZZ|nr:hypothetical protein [Actinomycetota bacterium]
MEILKFDESGSSSPSRKRSGRGAILVAFVAVVFGASTALASGTLAINSNDGIQLAQGVAQTVQCDKDGIDVSLVTSYDTMLDDFMLTGLDISKISSDCDGKLFTVKIYNDATPGVLQEFCKVGVNAGCSEVDSVATEATLPVDGTSLNYIFSNNLPTGTPTGINVAHVTVESSDAPSIGG